MNEVEEVAESKRFKIDWHNMGQALEFGNRMIMLHQGRIQLDVRGEEKQRLTIKEVIDKFGTTLKDETLLACRPEIP